MAYEKISEIPVREEKVKKLKEKILKEIGKEIERCKEDLIYDLTQEMDEELFEMTIKIMHGIYELKKYVENKHSFMRYLYKYNDNDIIIYDVPMRNIDIWLQDDYSFIQRLISEIEDGLIIETVLSDSYFGTEYISVFDLAIYNEKLEKNEVKNETSI